MSNIINISSVGQDPSKFSCKIPNTTIKPESAICLVGAKLYKNDLIKIDSTNDTFVLQWGQSDCKTTPPEQEDFLISYLPREQLKIRHGTYNVIGPSNNHGSKNPGNFIFAVLEALNTTQFCWWGFYGEYNFFSDFFSMDIYAYIKEIESNAGQWATNFPGLNDTTNGVILDNVTETQFTPATDSYGMYGTSQLVLPLDYRDVNGDPFEEPIVKLNLPNVPGPVFNNFRGAGILIITEQHFQDLLNGVHNDSFFEVDANNFIAPGTFNYISFTMNSDGEDIEIIKNRTFPDGTGDEGTEDFNFNFTTGNGVSYSANSNFNIALYGKIDEASNRFFIIARTDDGTVQYEEEFELNDLDFKNKGFRAIVYTNWNTGIQTSEIECTMKADLNPDHESKIGLMGSIGNSPDFNEVDLGGWAAYMFPSQVENGWQIRTYDTGVNLIVGNTLTQLCKSNNLEVVQQRKATDGKTNDWWYDYFPKDSSEDNGTRLYIDHPFGGGVQEYCFQVKNLQIASVIGSQYQGNNSNIIYNHFDGDNSNKTIVVNPENELYVKLTNTSDMVIDRLDIEITNLQNETLTELEGTSFLTLKFHENKTDKLIKQLIKLQSQNSTIKESINHNFINEIDNLANRVV